MPSGLLMREYMISIMLFQKNLLRRSRFFLEAAPPLRSPWWPPALLYRRVMRYVGETLMSLATAIFMDSVTGCQLTLRESVVRSGAK